MHDPARSSSCDVRQGPVEPSHRVYVPAHAPHGRHDLRTDALLEELRARIARHARPDETTAIDGVLLSAATRPARAPCRRPPGTVLALIAQGAKRLGDRRPGARLRTRAVPRRVGRPPDHGPLHARLGRRRPRWASGSSCARRRSPPCCSTPTPTAIRRAASARRRPGSASPTRRPSCSTPSSAWSGCSTRRPPSGACWRRCSSARSSGGCSPARWARASARRGSRTAA